MSVLLSYPYSQSVEMTGQVQKRPNSPARRNQPRVSVLTEPEVGPAGSVVVSVERIRLRIAFASMETLFSQSDIKGGSDHEPLRSIPGLNSPPEDVIEV